MAVLLAAALAVHGAGYDQPQAMADHPRVLVLNSYHPGYGWSDGEQDAVLHTLADGRPDIRPSVEYLDWRRFPNPARTEGLLRQFEMKYAGRPFDLIIALDDPAVMLVLGNRERFGADVPVVFGGVNDADLEVFQKHRAVTGVAQSYDFAGTLRLVQRLQPRVRRIAAVCCRTESGEASRRSLEKVIAKEHPPFAFDWIEGWTAQSLLQQLERLPDDTAVLIVSIFRDQAGKVLVDDPEFGRSLAERSRVPVYFVAPPLVRHTRGDTWSTAVWQGMGGSLLSEERHGELVGRLALRVLAGEPVENIPIVAESPARVAFDHRQLARHGIGTDALPPQAEVFHAPPTFYQVNRARIFAGLAVIAVLAATVLLLVWIILQRRRAEQALRRSNAHFQLIARATNDAVWDWDVTTGAMWWNDGYREQLRLAPGDDSGFAAWERHLHPEDRAGVLRALRDQMHDGDDHRVLEYRVVRSDAQIRHVYERVFFERNQAGRTVRVLGARLDLTERRQAELERMRLAAAVEQSANVVLLFDADGSVHYLNAAFRRATGLALPLGMEAVCRWFHPEPGEEPITPARLVADLEVGKQWSQRVQGSCPDGTVCLLQLAAFPIRNPAGPESSYVMVGTDVTRESKLEDQVRLSQKMEAVGLLAGGIAHDFNNLLQVIKGFGLQARDADTAEDRAECLHQVMEAAERAVQLTRQLLVFSRDDEAGPTGDLDLNDVLAGQIKMLRRLLDAQIEVVFKPTANPGNVRGDRGQLEQVFMNLCINARDAMPHGGRITVELEEVVFDEAYRQAHPWARRGRFMQVAVSDTGHGMDRATIARIFDPFFTTKPKEKGTGLGLAVVYGIVQKHEGLIHVYSEVGVGTTFRVFFPVQTKTAEPVRAEAPATPPPGAGIVLLVEDDPSVAKLATRVLERAGYAVVAAEDGEEGWARYQERAGAFVVVVLDAILPKLSGREVYERIRARDPRQPVLFCSGYSAGTIQPEFFPGDEVKMLGKPYDPAALLRAVGELRQSRNG